MDKLPMPGERPSVALLGAITRAQALGLRPDQIASVTSLTEAQITGMLESEAFSKLEVAQRVASRLPLGLLDFDELLDAALAAMGRMLKDPKTPALTKLRILEAICDRHRTGAFAKRTGADRPARRPSAVFDNEAIKIIKQQAAELTREQPWPDSAE